MAPSSKLRATKILNSIATRIQSLNADLSAAKSTRTGTADTSAKTSIAATSSHFATVTSYSDQIAPTTIPATITSTNAQGQAQIYTTNQILTTTRRVPYTTVASQTAKSSPCTTTGCRWPKSASLKCCEQRKKGWIAVIIVLVIALIILALLAFLIGKRKNNKKAGASQEVEEEVKNEEEQRMINDSDETDAYGAYTDTQKGATSYVKEEQNERNDHDFRDDFKDRQ